MNDLFKKLNVLVKAGINDLLGENQGVDSSQRKPLRPEQLGKDIDREIAALRQRINEALDYEDELQGRAQALTDEVARWDRQADDAVAAGNDASARHLISQMQGAQNRLAMAESDLHEHRLVTQELIQRVNTLEAAVADAKRAQAETQPVEGQKAVKFSGQVLSDVLRDAREKIASVGDLVSARQAAPSVSAPEEKADRQNVDDDLAQRRERLSKPK